MNFSVLQLIHSINKWNIVTRLIHNWHAIVINIKWFCVCNEFRFTSSLETRPPFITAHYIFASTLWREVDGASQVKKKGATVCLVLAILATSWLPVLASIATNAIQNTFFLILGLKQGDCSSLRITPWMEINCIPTMKIAAVEKSWCYLISAEQLYEESPHFICYLTTCIWQEGLYYSGYIVKRRKCLQSRLCLSLLR